MYFILLTPPFYLEHSLAASNMPLLHRYKKKNLDPLAYESYRPISNLPFLGKIQEKVVYNQLCTYLSQNSIFDAYQSGFRVNHSTEIAMVRVINELRIVTHNHKMSILVLLDLKCCI